MAVPGTALHWLGGAPPVDVSVCGFKNDNPICLTSQYRRDQPWKKQRITSQSSKVSHGQKVAAEHRNTRRR